MHAGDGEAAGLRRTDGEDGQVHGSGTDGGSLRCCIGSCGFCSARSTIDTDQLGPDQVPVFGTEVPAADDAIRSPLDRRCPLWGNSPVAASHLGEIGRGNVELCRECDPAATFLLDERFKVHATLAFAKVYVAFANVASAKVTQ